MFLTVVISQIVFVMALMQPCAASIAISAVHLDFNSTKSVLFGNLVFGNFQKTFLYRAAHVNCVKQLKERQKILGRLPRDRLHSVPTRVSYFLTLRVVFQKNSIKVHSKMLPSGSIKFEDISRRYRPVYGNPQPQILSLGPGTGCPFDGEVVTEVVKKQKIRKQRRGYCEMCKLSYTSLKRHTKSYPHQRYISNSQNFHRLDSIIDTLPTLSDLVQSYHVADAEHVNHVRNLVKVLLHICKQRIMF